MATTKKPKTPAKKTTKAAATPPAEPATAPGARGAALRSTQVSDPGLHDAIARRAYEIYEANGRAEGRDAEHWAQAEAEVLAKRARG